MPPSYSRAGPGARVLIRSLRVVNKGDARRELSADELADDGGGAPEVDRLRGYVYEREEVRELLFDTPGDFEVDLGEVRPLVDLGD